MLPHAPVETLQVADLDPVEQHREPDSGEAQIPGPQELGHSSSPRSTQPLFDTRQLQAFTSLARTGSFTQTARELRISQSAVSHCISDLERRLSCRLFDRTSRRVLLTLAGEQLLHHAEKITTEMEAAYQGLQALRSWGQIHLRIAAPASLCDGLFPACLLEIRRRYPNARISIAIADRKEALDELASGHVDLAVCPGSETDERFERTAVFNDDLVFVMAPSHRWASKPPLAPAEIGAEPLLTYRRNTLTWAMIHHHFSLDGIQPTIAVDCDSVATIRELARIGMGVGILARWSAETDISSGALACARLGRRPLIRKWAAFSLRSRRPSLVQTVFLEQLRLTAERQIAATTQTDASRTPNP